MFAVVPHISKSVSFEDEAEDEEEEEDVEERKMMSGLTVTGSGISPAPSPRIPQPVPNRLSSLTGSTGSAVLASAEELDNIGASADDLDNIEAGLDSLEAGTGDVDSPVGNGTAVKAQDIVLETS